MVNEQTTEQLLRDLKIPSSVICNKEVAKELQDWFIILGKNLNIEKIKENEYQIITSRT